MATNNCRGPSASLPFRKSRKSSDTANCVEVAICADHVHVRDSKDPRGPQLRFTLPEWRAFNDGVLKREFAV